MLNPFQLQQISDEYYLNNFMLGRDILWIHLKNKFPSPNVGPNGSIAEMMLPIG